MIRLRVGSDGVSAGLPDAGGEIVTVRVWCAVPVHDELIAKSWMRIDGLVSAQDKESIDLQPSLGSIRSDHHDHIAGWGFRPSGEFVSRTGGSPQFGRRKGVGSFLRRRKRRPIAIQIY